MKVLSGVIKPDSGSITLAGEIYAPDSIDEARAIGVGYVPQRIRIDEDMSVAEAIFRTSFRSTLDLKAKESEADHLLTDYGVDINPTDRLNDLVPAELATVEILRLACEETMVILLDEVSASFNDHEISLFHALASRLARQGRSVIHISHRIDELQSLSDRIAVIRDGAMHRMLVPRETKRAALIEEIFGEPVARQHRPKEPKTGAELMRLDGVTRAGSLAPTSLSIYTGEVVGITGLRCSGVTELATIIGGAARPDSGTLTFNGIQHEFADVDEALGAGIVNIAEDDEDALPEQATLTSSVIGDEASPEQSFASEARRLGEVIRLVKTLGVKTSSIHDRIGELSGGDQQKIKLASALRKPGVLFVLNQPTKGVDERSRQQIYELIDQLTEAGSGVVLISSDMTELTSRCHRIAIMREGSLVDVYPNESLNEDSIMVLALGYDWSDAGDSELVGKGNH
ncbi:ATP-binding cassette domain-containing protein [Brevibacterium sp. HMSC24B04]|uniref:ATP-binding cassette domain-containing protein n=1 Tax=Brevibacterium sp. HMSC24B04 TaxID=1581060 RepID=UPI0009F4184B|nr:ATP-binding cassette domain-containing protein [Brevibacterium sp. HMSC24B04]